MTPNEQHLESIEREWGNFDEADRDQREVNILVGLDNLLQTQRKIAKLAEKQMEQAEELRDAMREDGTGGY